jgi:hypothetical protein
MLVGLFSTTVKNMPRAKRSSLFRDEETSLMTLTSDKWCSQSSVVVHQGEEDQGDLPLPQHVQLRCHPEGFSRGELVHFRTDSKAPRHSA